MYFGFTALATEGSNLMKLYTPMQPINANQRHIIGAKLYPTFSVPNLWTTNKPTKIATDIQTILSVYAENKHKKGGMSLLEQFIISEDLPP